MATPPIFPNLPGQGWSVHKRPSFSTRVASHVSGREVRGALYAVTLYEFELTFDALAATAAGALGGLGATSLQTLLGFYLQCQGQFGTFLYVDPTDSVATGQSIATGDGATTTFTLVRTLGAFTEPVSYVTQVNTLSVNGVAQTGWSLASPNVITLASAPAAGAAITGSFAYAFLCRFLDDQQDFENVMAGLWQVQSLKFRSVKP
jgi:uncharacterized protein (TIGR02217 family)